MPWSHAQDARATNRRERARSNGRCRRSGHVFVWSRGPRIDRWRGAVLGERDAVAVTVSEAPASHVSSMRDRNAPRYAFLPVGAPELDGIARRHGHRAPPCLVEVGPSPTRGVRGAVAPPNEEARPRARFDRRSVRGGRWVARLRPRGRARARKRRGSAASERRQRTERRQRQPEIGRTDAFGGSNNVAGDHVP